MLGPSPAQSTQRDSQTHRVVEKLSIIESMGDTIETGPDERCLFETASTQHGHFTTEQAIACGYDSNLLTYHAKNGRFRRIHRGVYRLRDYPTAPRDEVVAAWLAVGKDLAVVSHESALDLFDLSDVIPNATHLTVPRTKRHAPKLPGVKIHTTTRSLARSDVVKRDGIRITSPARTIVDAADAGTGPEQVQLAIRQALQRGLTTSQRLTEAALGRSRRVRSLVSNTLVEAPG